MHTLESTPPEAIRLPLGDQATELTRAVCLIKFVIIYKKECDKSFDKIYK